MHAHTCKALMAVCTAFSYDMAESALIFFSKKVVASVSFKPTLVAWSHAIDWFPNTE